MPPRDDDEKQDFLEEAYSKKRGEDFKIMRENVLAHRLSPDDFLRFLTQFHRAFGRRYPNSSHEPPVDNGKFLI